ncbi:putative membrane protein [Penicillium digitatum]|uniref:Putative membrane protein n=1 Tax=Penicillium digitatum TaxID=36651 RepID=A0A7T7BH98_PENDI|nr:putative membrane protein [Penicillium digitatum]
MTAASGVTVNTSDFHIPFPPNAANSSQHEPQSTKGDPPTNQNEKETEGSAPQQVASEPAAGSAKQDHTASDEVDEFGLPIRVRRPDPIFNELPEGENASQNIQNAAVGSTGYSDAVKMEKEPELSQGKLDSGAHGPTNPNNTEERGKGAGAQDTSATPEYSQASYAIAPPRNSTSKQKKAQVSEWSHQRIAQPDAHHSESEESEAEPDEWQVMPALGEFDYYDDYGRLIARGAKEEGDEAVYQGLGGAGRGYTRVQLDEDVQSATSLDDDTNYLFREAGDNSAGLVGEELRDSTSQLQATKDLLNETQRIAYVGVVRTVQKASDAMRQWGQSIMGRVYAHMDINSAEQIMIEQLAEHGVQPKDLVPPLMQNARVKNPMAQSEPNTSVSCWKLDSPSRVSAETDSFELDPPPPYEAHETEEPPVVKMPSEMPISDRIDIDLRWTVLCDLFLVLIANSAYDARSRTLLERVGAALDVTWLQISRFEKRVTDSLEMQEQAEKENWDESDHMEMRRKMALKRKYMIMGLATVGGGLVIGLSAGLLAPVIGAGLAAGFTTVGISGTSAFLGGAGGTALIASGATLGGSTIGMRASQRRMGAVQTFEYRPLHNNKKVNLIVTVSGWMTGKVDDVRLPFSTVDPIMGDIYSVLWEPEMLRSMGDTINILATEALTQGLQQVLGSTVLMALMASLQLPLVLTKLAYLIDNPWIVSLARANSAGLVMADSLRERNLGNRPITLLGFSLGARVIFSCLKELAEKGAHGLIQNVYLFGSPIVADKDEYLKARSVVSGRFVNGYATNDWILGYLFRATSGGIMKVAGLAAVEGIPGIENFDITQLVNGHMDYRRAMPRILREVGWEVLEVEFAEIEDPDPDNHAERQRELIREIDEARREAEAKPEKKRFSLFKRGKIAEKKRWETYDVDKNTAPRDSNEPESTTSSILFDIEAIRAELHSEAIEVKELESTMPLMKLELNAPSEPPPTQPSPLIAKRPETPEFPAASRTISKPSQASGQYSPHGPNEFSPVPQHEYMELTFDTSFHDSPRSRNEDLYSRPELRSASTMPTVGFSALGAMAMEPNAWADYDLGHQDGEISMTFE